MKRNAPSPSRRPPGRPAANRRSVAAEGRLQTDVISAGHRALCFCLLAAGVLLYVLLASAGGVHVIGSRRWIIVAAATGVAMAPPVARVVCAALEAIRRPTPRARARGAVVVGILAAAYFVFTAVHQGRDLFPKTHDDQSYLLQMRMLAVGRLWMPQHELADFFDTFYVLVRPKYASFYFPGAALLYLPTIWLGLPTWLMPAAVAGAVVGLVYRLTCELLDGAAGLLAAIVLTSLSWFRVYSVLLTSHEPMLLMGLLMFWAWLRYRRRRHPGWLLAVGILAGWGAVTRPVDALCFAVPVGAALLLDLVRHPRGEERSTAPAIPTAPAAPAPPAPSGRDSSAPVRAVKRLLGPAAGRPVRLAATAFLLMAGAAPLLGLQLLVNHGISGRWLRTPYTLYLEQDQPNTSFGFQRYDPNAKPQSRVPQKQDYYQSFDVPFIKSHQPGNFLGTWARRYFPMIVEVALPAVPLVVLLPVGLLGLLGRRTGLPGDIRGRRVFLWVVPVFLGLYMLHVSFLEHYALLIVPAVLLLLLTGARVLRDTLPGGRTAEAGFTMGLCALCIVTLPELNALWDPARHPELVVTDETFPSPLMRVVHELVDRYNGPPALVLFPYKPGDPLYEEPVYNTQTAWPDDARVVLAHDLGPERDREIFAYYARTRLGRLVYRFDRNAARPEDKLVELGDARTLADRGAVR